MDTKNIKLPFKSWYKGLFTFADDTHKLEFVPEFSFVVKAEMSVKDAIDTDSDYILFDGEKVTEETQNE